MLVRRGHGLARTVVVPLASHAHVLESLGEVLLDPFAAHVEVTEFEAAVDLASEAMQLCGRDEVVDEGLSAVTR